LILLFILGLSCLFVLSLYLFTIFLRVDRIQLPLGLDVRILQISDLHMERNRIHPTRLLKLIKKTQPDLIVFTGDYCDSEKGLTRLETYLKHFSTLTVPMYAVIGNHDYFHDVDAVVDTLKSCGILVLRNEAITYKGVTFIGIDDFCTSHHDYKKIKAYFENKTEKIVILTHDPNIILDIPYAFSYMLTGHFHAKQFRVPFLFRLFPMGKLPTMGIWQGLHTTKKGALYINRGIGQSGINARFLVCSEVAVHDI
jgi:predicted MPP superfamily phosphohydrolase